MSKELTTKDKWEGVEITRIAHADANGHIAITQTVIQPAEDKQS